MNAISRTPRIERKEFISHAHFPAIIKLSFGTEAPPISNCLEKLADIMSHSVVENKRHELKSFFRQACLINADLGPWAADFFVTTAIQRLSEEVKRETSITDLWKDPLKMALGDLLFGLLDLSPVPLISSNVSDRVRLLLDFLQSENEQGFSGIIFVRERVKVFILTELLSQHPKTRSRFYCAPFVGESNRGRDTHCFWERNQKREQADSLDQFRMSRVNLIVATSVLEEGIDVNSCHTVISFDPPDNVKSFIQRRGRARQKLSKFVLMIPKESRDWISRWKALEAEMVHMYADQERIIAVGKPEDNGSEKLPQNYKLKNG